jgi:hypothetical protein
MTRPRRHGLAPAGAAALVLLLAGAAAEASRPRVALTSFAGPYGEQVRHAVATRLSARYEVVMSPGERGAGGRPAAGWASLARRLNAVAVVDGVVARGTPWRARLMVHSGDDGSAAGTLVWSNDRPRELLQDVVREGPGKVSFLVARTRAATAGRERAVEVAAAAEVVEPDPIPPPPEAEASLLEAALGPRVVSRTLAFTDNAAGMPGYRLAAAPALGGEVVLYPAARTSSWVRHLGLAGSGEASLGATTRGRESGSAQSTQYRAQQAGLRFRVPLSPVALRLGLDYGQQRFDVDLSGERPNLSPAVRYRYLRPSLAVRLEANAVAFTLTGGYLHVLSATGLADPVRFPRASVVGVDAGAKVAYRFRADLEVEGTLDFRRYAYSMNALPGDPVKVGGAADDFLGAGLMLTYRMR